MTLGELFGSIYTSFGLEDLYGSGEGELANYLWGEASSKVTTNQFIGIGLVTIGVTFLFVLAYYYALGSWMRKPSWGNRWTWGVVLVLNGFAAFGIGWWWTISDLYAGDKMVTTDPTTNQLVSLPIYVSNCLCFGIANTLVAMLLFFVLSFVLKWWSRDYSHIPF